MAYRGTNLLLRAQQRAALDKAQRQQNFQNIQQAMAISEDIKNRQFERQRQQAEMHGRLAEQLMMQREPYAKAPHEEAAMIGQMEAKAKRQQMLQQQEREQQRLSEQRGYKEGRDIAGHERDMALAKLKARPFWAKLKMEKEKNVPLKTGSLDSLQKVLEKMISAYGTAMNTDDMAQTGKVASEVATYNDLVKRGIIDIRTALSHLKSTYPDIIPKALQLEATSTSTETEGPPIPGTVPPGSETEGPPIPGAEQPGAAVAPQTLKSIKSEVQTALLQLPKGHPDSKKIETVLKDISEMENQVANGFMTEQEAIEALMTKAQTRPLLEQEPLTEMSAPASVPHAPTEVIEAPEPGVHSFIPGKGFQWNRRQVKNRRVRHPPLARANNKHGRKYQKDKENVGND